MDGSARSLENTLNRLIDDELKKDTENSDDELVLACCDGLLRLDDVERYVITEKQVEDKLREIADGKKLKPAKKISKTVKVMLTAAIIALLLVGAVFGISEYKYSIIKHADHSTISFNSPKKKIKGELTVGYIPEGFELVDNYDSNSICSKSYRKDNSFFDISVETTVKEYDINTEYGDAKTISVDNIDYIVYGEETHGYGIIWKENDYVYALSSGDIGGAELLKIAESISVK